jgi:hypothetical protein
MQTPLPPIEPRREWTKRHAHHHLRLVEDTGGRIWLHVDDLHQWLPGFASSEALHRRCPGMVRCVPPSRMAFLEISAFLHVTKKSTNTPALKLRIWLETTVLEPLRRREQGREYAGGFWPRLPSSLLLANEIPVLGAEGLRNGSDSKVQRALDPRLWRIASGQCDLKATMIVGFMGAAAGVAVSGYLNGKAWNVDNNYLFWTWVALFVAIWAVGFNAAWVIGALRSGMRRVGNLFNPWLTIALVTLNLIMATYMAGVTLQNSTDLVHLWWKAYVVGDPPARVEVTERDVSGRVQEITLSGGLGIGSTNALRQALSTYPEATLLVLSSPGGLVIEGFGLADALAASGIQTTMVKDQCSSACTIPFLLADRRVVGPEATVGFHRSYSIFGDFGQGWSATEHRMADLMRERGVTETFVQRAFSTPGWDIYEARVDELIANGVATEGM